MRRAILLGCLLAPFVSFLPQARAQSSVYSSALPPSAESLDRLRLKTEWAINVPVDGRTDGITQVQVADKNQVYVQTKSGEFLVYDATNGQLQWSYRFMYGRANSFPIATNSRYAFVANLSSIYCFNRYSGILEFKFDPILRVGLPMSTITSGPVCDEDHLYIVIGKMDVMAYLLPTAVKQPDPAANKDALAAAKARNKITNPADEVAKRFPGVGSKEAQPVELSQSRGIPAVDVTINTHQVSPSISVLPAVTPPYTMKDKNGLAIQRTESMTAINSLRFPYRIHDAEGRYIVKSPSVTVIPPSVARVQELNSIRPKGLEPQRQYVYEATNRIQFEPTLAGARLWLTFESPRALAFDRLEMIRPERSIQSDGSLSASPSSAMVSEGSNGYLALSDGSLVSIDLSYGGINNQGALKQMWRANVGGPMDHKVILTSNDVFVGGTSSGVGRINRAAGELNWRTQADDDTILAVNEETVYTRTANGIVRVYDQKSVTDAITKKVVPVGELALPGFAVPVTNTANDRIFLASQNGLLVCLRDSSPKYALPKPVITPKVAKVEGEKKKDADPMANPMTPATPAEPMTPAEPKKN